MPALGHNDQTKLQGSEAHNAQSWLVHLALALAYLLIIGTIVATYCEWTRLQKLENAFQETIRSGPHFRGFQPPNRLDDIEDRLDDIEGRLNKTNNTKGWWDDTEWRLRALEQCTRNLRWIIPEASLYCR